MKSLFKNPRNLALLGLMLAITIILDMTPLGMIPLGTISATIVHIPTIITGVILGPVAGFIMGTAFGIVTLIHAATRPVTVLDPLFINPLVSVLPRMFIGVASYYVFLGMSRLLKKSPIKNTLSSFAGGMAGSLTNTGLVFLMLYLVYAREVVEKLGVSFGAFLIAIFTTNAIAEAIIGGIITAPIAVAYYRFSNTANNGR